MDVRSEGKEGSEGFYPGQLAGLVVAGVIVHGVGSSGGSLVVCREDDLSHFRHDDFEVPWDIPEQCLGGCGSLWTCQSRADHRGCGSGCGFSGWKGNLRGLGSPGKASN